MIISFNSDFPYLLGGLFSFQERSHFGNFCKIDIFKMICEGRPEGMFPDQFTFLSYACAFGCMNTVSVQRLIMMFFVITK